MTAALTPGPLPVPGASVLKPDVPGKTWTAGGATGPDGCEDSACGVD